jgi:hypothetical protein
LEASQSNEKIYRPLAFLDTSAWNMLTTIAGGEILRWLIPQYRLAYSDSVIQELLRDQDTAKRATIFDVMKATKAVRLFIPYDAPHPQEARWELIDPEIIEASPDQAPAMMALLQKFHGAQKNQTLLEVHNAFAGEARRAAEFLEGLGYSVPEGFYISLSESAQHLPKNANDPGTNARIEFQKGFDIDLSQISPQAIHPPNILSQLWEYLKPKFKKMGYHPSSMEDFFVPPLGVRTGLSDPCGVYDRCIPMYNMLNFVGFCADSGLTKDHRVVGTIRDAWHVAFGSLCSTFVVADEQCFRKAFVIYEYYRRSRAVYINLNGNQLSISSDWR